ncbi:5-formyltetrahydrofolate cyclo-ligase [Pseudoroseomonas globiformis]|uniref:5-formyltetrahydrofolate cyclo-ligase n=1 Tax=Teichococcus globiformis TaxID=2307229 RepID=A0ABV7G420_9PROT
MAAPHSLSQSPNNDPPALVAEKVALRQQALARRAGADPTGAGEALTALFLARAVLPPRVVVGGFWPMGDEIDIRPLLHRLHAAGHPLALPVTPRRGQPLPFRSWRPGEKLVPGRFGTSVPEQDDMVVPGLLLVPLLAFDRRGYRLGYGGGFYDRTLAGWPDVLAIGVAYARQEVASVPTGPYDRPLAAIATEADFILPEKVS